MQYPHLRYLFAISLEWSLLRCILCIRYILRRKISSTDAEHRVTYLWNNWCHSSGRFFNRVWQYCHLSIPFRNVIKPSFVLGKRCLMEYYWHILSVIKSFFKLQYKYYILHINIAALTSLYMKIDDYVTKIKLFVFNSIVKIFLIQI